MCNQKVFASWLYGHVGAACAVEEGRLLEVGASQGVMVSLVYLYLSYAVQF